MGSDAQRFSRLWLGALIAAGIAQGWSLAWPWGEDARGETVPALSIVALVLLARSLGGVVTARDAAWRSGVFHVAAFATSFGWLHISMHQFGGMPLLAAVAAVGVLAAGLALIPAGVFYLAWRLRAGRPGRIADTAVFAGAWLLAECLRAQLGTGFPWGAIGYAQVDSPLRALAPWMGVYGLGFVVAALAYLLANGFRRVRSWRAHWVRLLWVGGVAGLTLVAADKAQPVLQATPGLQVRLLQGNVPQDQKFVHQLQASLMDYGQAILSSPADLTITPETAMPVERRYWPEALASRVQAALEAKGQLALVGLPATAADLSPRYSNTALAMGSPTPWRYDKYHLVPFGEFIPPGFRWFVDQMQIPLGDFARGELIQPLLHWKGERIAAHICFEDLFGEELAANFVTAQAPPTLLVNMSNLAWFGESVAIDQHLHIARMRALELARPILRATNTGATAVIDARGEVVARLPYRTKGALDATIQGNAGPITPYARWVGAWGLWPLMAWALFWMALGLALGGAKSRA